MALDRVAEEADTSTWLSRRGALLAAAISVGLLIIAVVIALLFWITPATEPLNVPSVPRG